MNESVNDHEFSWNRGMEGSYGAEVEPDEKSRRPAGSRRWFVLALLFMCFASFTGLQIWGAGEFRKGIGGIEQEVRKLNERLRLLENTAGERKVMVFLNDVESLSRECQEKMQTTAELRQQWWFILPFLKEETVVQELSNLQQELNEIVAVRPTIEAFSRRLIETDDRIAGVMDAIGAADAGGAIVELASFIEDSDVLRKDIERTQWPPALAPFKEAFLNALHERDAALNALLAALDSAAKAQDFAEQAVGAYITAWSIWDYQEVLDYLDASDEYSSQAEGYMAEFEFHTARYFKIRDRLIELPTSGDETPPAAEEVGISDDIIR